MLTQAPGSGVANDLGVAFLIFLLYLFFILPFSEIYNFVFASQPHRSIGAATLINIVCVGSSGGVLPLMSIRRVFAKVLTPVLSTVASTGALTICSPYPYPHPPSLVNGRSYETYSGMG